MARSNRKVKSGCRTCKIRKVKCDEAKPACERCVSTGRVCDGYGIWGGGGTGGDSFAPAARRPSPPGSTTAVVALPQHRMPAPAGGVVSSKDQFCFEWFFSRTSRKLPGAFPSAFWDKLVFQASSTEPSVLYAVLALSSAQRSESMFRSQFSKRPPAAPDREEQLMLRNYSKAIGHLQRDVLVSDRASVRVALISCLLFTCMEYLRGHYRSGNLHLQNGANLLGIFQDHADDQSPTPAKLSTDFVDYWISETFSRLYVQAALFGQVPASLCVAIPGMDTDMAPRTFYSSSHARHVLDRLVGKVLLLSERCRLLPPTQDPHSCPELVGEQRTLRAHLASWYQAYESSQDYFQRERTLLGSVAIKLIRPYQAMAEVMAATCLDVAQESAFDLQMSVFARIMAQTTESFKMALELKSEPIKGYGMHGSRSISDIGSIPPIYYTALKCRNHRLRLQAVRFLRIITHKEAIWDAQIALCIAEEVVRLEEQDFFNRFDMDDDFIVYSPPTESDYARPPLPEAHRFNHVQVILPDDYSKNILLECHRRHGDGTSTTITREFDSIARKWFPPPMKTWRKHQRRVETHGLAPKRKVWTVPCYNFNSTPDL